MSRLWSQRTRKWRQWLGAVCMIFVSHALVAANTPPALHGRNRVPAPAHVSSHVRLPNAYFEENRGQAPAAVKFLAQQGRSRVTIGEGGIAWSAQPLGAPNASQIRLSWASPSTGPHAIEGATATGGRSNYIFGNDQKKWILGARHFRAVREADVYPGIDVVYRALQDKVRYDFVVAPNADPAAIRIAIGGAVPLLVADGSLRLKHGELTIDNRSPTAYQTVDGKRLPVGAKFRLLADNTVGFALGIYDHTKALTIDPTVVFSSFLGGTQDDEPWGIGVTKNETLNDLVSGLTRDTVTVLLNTDSTNMPTAGSASTLHGGADDVFVAKLDGDGQALIYATYLGGTAADDGWALAVDNNGYAYVTGSTLSKDFPVLAAFQPVSHSVSGISDGLLFKLDPRGAPVYSTYFAGYQGTQAYAVTVDGGGNAAIAGYTADKVGGAPPNFPTVNPAQANANSTLTSDAFVARFNANGQPVFSTFLGGDGEDVAFGVAYDLNGNVFTTGYTASNNLFVTGNALQSTCGSTVTPCSSGQHPPSIADAFLTIHSAAGALEYASYLGGTQYQQGNAISVYQPTQVDNAEVSVGGYTTTTDFSTANAFQGASGGGTDGFVSTFVATPAFGVSVAASSYLGGSGYDAIYAMATDRWGNVYAAGETASANFPLVNSLQSSSTGDAGFVSIFQSPVAATNGQPGSPLRFSTRLGGSGSNYVNAVVPDDFSLTRFAPPQPGNTSPLIAGGGMYVALGTTSPDFPIQRPLVQNGYNGGVYHGGYEAAVAKIGLCNHMNALPAAPQMQPAVMLAIGPPRGQPPVDLRVVNVDQAVEENTRLAVAKIQGPVDTKALKFVQYLETQPSVIPNRNRTVSVEWDRSFGTVASLSFNYDPLRFDRAKGESDQDRVKRFILAHPELFQLSETGLRYFKISPLGHEGDSSFIKLTQQFDDIPFFRSHGITFNFNQGGDIHFITAHYYPADQPPETKPLLGVSDAYAALRKHVPNWWKTADGRPSPHDGATGPLTIATEERLPPIIFLGTTFPSDMKIAYTRVSHVGMDFTDNLDANLVYYQVGADLHLGWYFTSRFSWQNYGGGNVNWAEAIIDADNGELLFAKTHLHDENVVSEAPSPSFASRGGRYSDIHAAKLRSPPPSPVVALTAQAVATTPPQGTVFIPNPDVGMAVEPLTGDPTASPDGWLDRFGATFYSLGGNNACAEDRSYAQPTPPAGKLPDYLNGINWRAYSPVVATGQFNFPWTNAYRTSNGTDKTTDIDIALTNAFYWVNLAHDRFYALGFDEAHHNFQRRNFQRDPATGLTLGQGDDEVQVFVHFSAVNFSNSDASFAKGPDGYRPYMELYLGNTAPYSDFAVDGGIVLHEYAHGVTARMIGNASTIGLNSQDLQPRALSEGWSDFFAASILADPAIGAYVSGNPQTGLRKYALDNNPMTLATFCCDSQALTQEAQVYESEQLWASTLWDMRSLLRQSYGDQAGTKLAEQVVIKGLSNIATDDQVAGFVPTIVRARFDLLQAAQAKGTTPGQLADYALACRGLGKNATTGGTSDQHPVADFTLSTGSLCQGLSIFANDAPDPVPVQSQLTYTITVTNGSPVPGAAGPASDNTQVAFILPASLSNAVAVPDLGTCAAPSGSSLTCTLGTLAYGAQTGIVLTGTPQAPGTITLQATVSGDIGGPNPGQPTTSATSTVCIPDLVFSNGFESSSAIVICQ